MPRPIPAPPKIPAALLLAALASACAEPSAPPPTGPNVLILSLDSVRPDELSLYGGVSPYAPDEVISPHIDALAAGGVTFDDAVSTTSWTLPSHMAMLTGLADQVHGVTDNHQRLDPGIVTLAELLGERGYRTAGFFSGPNLHPVFGFSQGFERYDNMSSNDPHLSVFTSKQPGALVPVHKDSHEDVTSPALVEGASDFLAEMAASEEPFLCFVHWWDPHYDYMAPSSFVERFVRPDFDAARAGVHGKWETDKLKQDWDAGSAADLLALYHSELAYTDFEVGRLLDRLNALGLAEDTLVILVSDHGEEFFDHGRWGHQRTLHEEVVKVPLVLRLPGTLPEDVRAAGQARLQDLFATVADLCDVALPAYHDRLDEVAAGRSLRPLWEDPTDPGLPAPLLLDVPYRSVHRSALRFRDGDGHLWKVELDHTTKQATLYDLIVDPIERAPIAGGHYERSKDPRVVRAREAILTLGPARDVLPLEGAGEATLTPEIRAELARLGYF